MLNVTERDTLYDDDDIPWASPEIRANYEAALGRFILAFNQLDNLLTEIIEIVLRRLKRDDLVKSCIQRDFSNKVLIFDLLKLGLQLFQIMRSIALKRRVPFVPKIAMPVFDLLIFDNRVVKGQIISHIRIIFGPLDVMRSR